MCLSCLAEYLLYFCRPRDKAVPLETDLETVLRRLWGLPTKLSLDICSTQLDMGSGQEYQSYCQGCLQWHLLLAIWLRVFTSRNLCFWPEYKTGSLKHTWNWPRDVWMLLPVKSLIWFIFHQIAEVSNNFNKRSNSLCIFVSIMENFLKLFF